MQSLGIPYNQALCLKKICTGTSEISKNLDVLKGSFINPGFNKKVLDREFKQLSKIERNASLALKLKGNNQNITKCKADNY